MQEANNIKKLTEFKDNSLLIVDDDNPFRERLARAMEKKGFQVSQAESVKNGIESVKSKKPAWAVSNLNLNSLSPNIERVPSKDVANTSVALGFGFRCGFLGPLHMEIIQERLEREFDLDLVTTTPNVIYEVLFRNEEIIKVDTPAKMPLLEKLIQFLNQLLLLKY